MMLLTLVLFGTTSAFATPSLESLQSVTLVSQVSNSTEPLTTAKIREFSPLEPNPHLLVWALERTVELKGLAAHHKGDGSFGVKVEGILSKPKVWIRPQGSWFADDKRFSCAPEPDAWFSQSDGAKLAAKKSSESWNELVKQKKNTLLLKLGQVHAASAEAALTDAKTRLSQWQLELAREWRVSAALEARRTEWAFYLQKFHTSGRCKSDTRIEQTPPSLRSRMEQPALPEFVKGLKAAVQGLGRAKLLARTPAKRWNGLFTVRVLVLVGGKRLSGQFLVDSGASASLISPEFLARQGVAPETVRLKNVAPKRMVWSEGNGLASVVGVEALRLGNEPDHPRELLLVQTDLFAPPEFKGTCCDGVLGADYLRDYVLELESEPRARVLMYDREEFFKRDNRGENWGWIGVEFSPQGELLSPCSLETKASGAWTFIPGARMDSGLEAAAELHSPWMKDAFLTKYRLRCEDQILADPIPVRPTNTFLRSVDGPFVKKDPGFTVGMDFWGRKTFVLDLGNGRIWFDTTLAVTPFEGDPDGLKFKFIMNPDDQRELRVDELKPSGKFAKKLLKLGLTENAIIATVNGEDARDLDLWEVAQAVRPSKKFEISFKETRTTAEARRLSFDPH